MRAKLTLGLIMPSAGALSVEGLNVALPTCTDAAFSNDAEPAILRHRSPYGCRVGTFTPRRARLPSIEPHRDMIF